MKIGAFLVCSLLFAGNYVDSRSLPPENGEFSSAVEDLNVAKEFLESTLAKINNIEADDDYETKNLKNHAEYAIGVALEVIKLGPSKAIEIEENLSEIVELIHQASEIESNGDELEAALKKVEMAEEIITQIRNNEQDAAIKNIKYMMEIVNEIKAKVDANPDNFLEQLEDAQNLPQMLAGAPKHLNHLLKKNFFEIFEQLWNADLAVESIKDTFPAEAEQLKTILREVEDKMNVLRIGTKKWVAKINLTIAVSMFPSEDLMAALQNVENDYTQDKISIGGQMTISEDDPQFEEMKTKMIGMGELLEGENSKFFERLDDLFEMIKSNFPEENQLEPLLDELKIKTSELKESIKTIVDKIKLDASEGVKTNCLYVEMFVHVLKDKFNVYMRNLDQMGKIFQSLQTELPDGEVKSAMDKAVEEMNSIMTSESDPFNEFLKQSIGTFYVFGVGMPESDTVPDETDMFNEMGGF